MIPVRAAGLLAILAGVASCGTGEDPRLENLTVGISRDSTIAVMGGERPSRVDPYLVGGNYIESMLFVRPGTEPAGADTLPDRERTPVVVINGTLSGWGWDYWDSVATAHNIPLSPEP